MSNARIDPVTYAEDTLGVHRVYEEAERRYNEHAMASDALDRTSDEIRSVRAEIEASEIELVSDLRAKHNDLSKTAFGELLKERIKEDADLRVLRTQLAHLEGVRAEYERQVKHHQLGIHLATARMEELGGLLEFYAACKLVNSQTTVTHVSSLQEEGH